MIKKMIYFLGSLITVLSSFIYLKKKKQAEKSEGLSKYQGTWFFSDSQQKQQLQITSDYTFLINGQSLGTSVVEIDEYRLVVRDQYGFYLIFSYPEQTLYDASADTSYKLLSEKYIPPNVYISFINERMSPLYHLSFFVVKTSKNPLFFI